MKNDANMKQLSQDKSKPHIYTLAIKEKWFTWESFERAVTTFPYKGGLISEGIFTWIVIMYIFF